MNATYRWLGALLLACTLPCACRAQNQPQVIWYTAALCYPLGRAPDFCSVPPVYGVDCNGYVVGPNFCVYPPFNPVSTFPPFQDVSKLPKLQKKKRQRCPEDEPKPGAVQNGPPPAPPNPGFGQPYPPGNPGFGQPHLPMTAALAPATMSGYPGQGQPGPAYASYSGYGGTNYSDYPAQPGPYTTMAQAPAPYQASAVAGAYTEVSPFLRVQAPPTFTFPVPQSPPMPQQAPPMPMMPMTPRTPGSSALPNSQMTQPGIIGPLMPAMPLMPQAPQVRVAMPYPPMTPTPPVPPPAPIYVPMLAPGAPPGPPTHPYAHGPRDFFMWNEVYEGSMGKARYPALVR